MKCESCAVRSDDVFAFYEAVLLKQIKELLK